MALTVIVQKKSLDSVDLCAGGPRTYSLQRRVDLRAPWEAAVDRAVAWPASQALGTSSRAAGMHRAVQLSDQLTCFRLLTICGVSGRHTAR
jgi:hypothetical protein